MKNGQVSSFAVFHDLCVLKELATSGYILPRFSAIPHLEILGGEDTSLSCQRCSEDQNVEM